LYGILLAVIVCEMKHQIKKGKFVRFLCVVVESVKW